METDINKTFSYERSANYRKIKSRLVNVLKAPIFCCICYDSEKPLISLTEKVPIQHWESNNLKSVQSILQTVFGQQFEFSSHHVCIECNAEVVRSYMFILEAKISTRMFTKLVEELHMKIEECGELISISQSEYANTVVILNDPCESLKQSEQLIQQETQKKINMKKETVFCDYCNAVYKSKKSLIGHINKLHLDINVGNISNGKTHTYCEECCSKNCIHKEFLESYAKQKVCKMKYIQCINCDYKCKTKKTLIVHANNEHLKVIKVICKSCSMQFNSYFQYKQHISQYHSTLHNCMYCDHEFRSRINMEKHKEVCQNIKKRFACDKCPCSFDVRSKLNNHKTKKHLENFKCDICSKTFCSDTLLENHKQLHAGKKKTYKRVNYNCFYCNKHFQSAADRAAHISGSHGPGDKPTCTYCNLVFDSSKKYHQHNLTISHLRNINPLAKYRNVCKQCNYSACTVSALEQHVNRFHLKILPYTCTICSKKFAGKTKLKEHLKIHKRTEKEYICDYCEKGFYGSSALKKHVRVHTGECPYLCDICGLSFRSSSLKNYHQLKHSDKKFKCPLCERKFYCMVRVRAHIKNMHWKKKEPFDLMKVDGLTAEDKTFLRDRRMINIDQET